MSSDWYKQLEDRKNPLIKQIAMAVDKGQFEEPFTLSKMKSWIELNNIRKSDGEPYKSSSIGSLLSDSDIKNRPSKNRNIAALSSRLDPDGYREYWFTEKYWDWVRSFR